MHRSKNLEIHVVDHCNLDCVGCSHESPLMPRRVEDPAKLAEALTLLWDHYRAPLVKLLGGEPLLHPRLTQVVQAVQAATRARVRLVTNGTLLTKRYHRLQGVDEVHISHYPHVPLPTDPELQQIASALGASITVQDFDAFRWHRSSRRHSRELTERVFRTCQPYHSWDCHTLRDGWFYPCPPAATWGDTSEGIDLLDTAVDVTEGLDGLLSRREPLGACETCLGSVGRRFTHRRGWRTTSTSPVTPTVDGTFLVQLEQAPGAWNHCYEYRRTIRPSGEIEHHTPT
jgi:organic radical activating enzyme